MRPLAVFLVGSLLFCTAQNTQCSGPSNLTSERSFIEIPHLQRPAKGVVLREPTYGTCIRRLTDYSIESDTTGMRTDYSRRQAFNADNTRVLISALNGYWHVYNAETMEHMLRLNGLAGDAEPQWDPVVPHTLYFLPRLGVGLQVLQIDVRTNQWHTLADFNGRLPWPGAYAARTRSEGSPSADGRYWAFQAETSQWDALGAFVWDKEEDRIVSTFDYQEHGITAVPDHLSMSPSGDFVVISADPPGTLGTRAYRRDFSSYVQVHHKSEHSDLAVLENGHDAYVSVDYQQNEGPVFFVDLHTGERTELFHLYIGGPTTALHVSGKGYGKPGWVMVSTYNGGPASQWFHKKLMGVELRSNPTIYTLAHTHTTSAGYLSEPHASVDRMFTRVIFNSNFGVQPYDNVDAYVLELPSDGLVSLPPGGGGDNSPPPTPSPTPQPASTPPPTPSSPPVLSTTSASWFPYGTQVVEIAVATNVGANCRMSYSGGYPFGALYLSMDPSPSHREHRFYVTVYPAGDKVYYVRCKALESGAENNVDHVVELRVATSPEEMRSP